MTQGTAGPPPAPADRRQLDQVLSLVNHVLGSGVVGAYLHGSAVLGGLRPRSDLDVLVVSSRPTSRSERRRLASGLLGISGNASPGGPRPLELIIVVESDIRPWRYPPRFDFLYGEWLRSEFERGDVEPWATAESPDLALLIAVVLLGDRALLGPRPREIFEPVPLEDRLDAAVSGIDALLDDLQTDTRNVLLTLARIWATVVTGNIYPKDAAAAWAIQRAPAKHQTVLERARAIYLGDEDERWEDLEARIRPCAEYLSARARIVATERG